ncbi:hypothetical protein BAT_3136 [Bacillus pumilus ATCC 7061]|nr:hypothetical protein BAT_3136 [Bacillus pumilus ATCC 7061]
MGIAHFIFKKRRSIDNAADGAGFRGKTFESASDNLSFNRIEEAYFLKIEVFSQRVFLHRRWMEK